MTPGVFSVRSRVQICVFCRIYHPITRFEHVIEKLGLIVLAIAGHITWIFSYLSSKNPLYAPMSIQHHSNMFTNVFDIISNGN